MLRRFDAIGNAPNREAPDPAAAIWPRLPNLDPPVRLLAHGRRARNAISWNVGKERQNARKHGLDLSFAAPVFADPLAVTVFDRVVDGEERWHTIGAVAAAPIFKVPLVVHTYPMPDDENRVRVISLREADPRERKRYEEQND
jgi:uncharacterized DUF497 family protein